MSRLDDAVAALRRGELVAAPTETLIGLLADASSEAAVAKVACAKGRAEGKPIGVILPDLAALTRVAVPLMPRAETLALAHWPGPLTLVVPALLGLPEPLVHEGKIALRVPGPSLALDLVREFGGPLTATSANVSSAPAVRHTDALDDAIIRACGLVIPGAAHTGEPSTLLDVSVWPPRCLRDGAVPRVRWLATVQAAG